MTSPRQTLPDFEDPPVVETAVGVEFAPLEKWSIPHFGLFLHEIESDYSNFEVQGSIGVGSGQVFELSRTIPLRCLFLNQLGNELIQVQSDRFFYNWRKVVGTEEYPHFTNIKPAFARDWGRFCDFLRTHKIGVPEVRQCEVTYVNILEQGREWDTLADLGAIFPAWASRSSSEFLPAPEAVAMAVVYSMPDEQGQLSIQLQQAIRNTDGKEILQLTLTARSRPTSLDLQDILECLDRGQEWVVRGFTDFTSPGMHDRWKRRTRT